MCAEKTSDTQKSIYNCKKTKVPVNDRTAHKSYFNTLFTVFTHVFIFIF